MKVLSLFDGISCAYVALKRAGFKVDKYVASEIDRYAIEISQKNHPDIIDGQSFSQRYKACGNAFNVDVVAHILSFIKKHEQKERKNSKALGSKSH